MQDSWEGPHFIAHFERFQKSKKRIESVAHNALGNEFTIHYFAY